MADSKLPQKLIRENPFKRLITRLVLLAFLNQNLAFATHSIIELDFKDSQASQRLPVIPRLSNVGDVSHIEIDTEQKQVAVYLKEKQEEALDEVEKNSSQGADVPVITKPVILQKHNIMNLPWELEPEKLTLFILNHTAWLSPLDEDGYKLEFRGGLLGGMMKKKELTITVYPGGVDCGGRNDWPKGTIGDKFCRNNGNGLGNTGIIVFNKPYVPPVDHDWAKKQEQACNPFGNQKPFYIPPREDKKPELKKVSVPSFKAPIFKADDKKIHQAVGKEVREAAQPLINKLYFNHDRQFRDISQKILDFVMEAFAPYQGGDIPQKTLDEIVRNIGLRIDPMIKKTDSFLMINPNDYYRALDKDGRCRGKSVDQVSREAVSRTYEGLKKQYAEELEKFKKSQKIEEEKLEKAKKEQAIKEEQIRLEQEQSKIQKMTSPDEYDRHYIETRLLPHILKMVGHSYYPAYKDYQAFVNNLGTGYKIGMSINDYWQSWLNSKKWGEVAKKNPLPTYKLPMHLVRDQETFDRNFIETTLLPHIRKYTSHSGYKDYQSFISTTGTGYKPGMDMNAYMDSWKNWKGGVIKDFPKYGVPDTCNPFYGDYEKLKRVQTLINTVSWEAVYDYANKEGFSKEDVQYVNARRTETIPFDSYMKEVFDDQVLEDWGAKDWNEAVKLIQVGKKLPFDIDPMKPHDMFNLEDKMAGCGAGGGKLGWGRILGKGNIKLPDNGRNFIKLRGNQGWKNVEDKTIWKKDMLHKDHWDVMNEKGVKIKEIDFNGKELWPNGPKNKNK